MVEIKKKILSRFNSFVGFSILSYSYVLIFLIFLLQVPTQGPPQLMYTGGPNPSVSQTTNASADNTQAVQVAPGPPTPYYIPPAIVQTPEIYYNMQPAPSQGCFAPIVTLASHDNVMHYCDVSVEQNSNNVTPEASISFHICLMLAA